MTRLRAILFTSVVLLFPVIPFVQWVSTSSAVGALISHLGMEREQRPATTAISGEVKSAVSRLRQDDPSAFLESRFALVRPFLPRKEQVVYLADADRSKRTGISAERTFLYAQYAVAPTVLTDSAEANFVLVNLSTEAALDMVLAGQGTACEKRIVAADSSEADDLKDGSAGMTQPVLAAPRLRPVDYQRQIYRCGETRFKIVQRFGYGLAILERATDSR